jgi:hypothetical protein
MLGCISSFCAGASPAVPLNRAQKTQLRHPLPVGYAYDDQNRVVIDPDAEVRGAIALAFHVFLEAGSAYAVVHDPIRPAPAYALVRPSAIGLRDFSMGNAASTGRGLLHTDSAIMLLQTNVGSVARSSASSGSPWPAYSHTGAGAQGRHPVYW